jgi:hypothetical protein
MHIDDIPETFGACPRCGARWGHPNPELDFPNRQKVDHFWKCYNPACTAAFYDPEANEVVEDEPSPEEREALDAKIRQEVADMMVGMKWVTRTIAPGITSSQLVPIGEKA